MARGNDVPPAASSGVRKAEYRENGAGAGIENGYNTLLLLNKFHQLQHATRSPTRILKLLIHRFNLVRQASESIQSILFAAPTVNRTGARTGPLFGLQLDPKMHMEQYLHRIETRVCTRNNAAFTPA